MMDVAEPSWASDIYPICDGCLANLLKETPGLAFFGLYWQTIPVQEEESSA
jgi:hypothetical protein